MEIKGEAKLVRFLIGESDKIEHISVYEKIVLKARESGLAGATVFKGIMGSGRTVLFTLQRFCDYQKIFPLLLKLLMKPKKTKNSGPYCMISLKKQIAADYSGES